MKIVRVITSLNSPIIVQEYGKKNMMLFKKVENPVFFFLFVLNDTIWKSFPREWILYSIPTSFCSKHFC